MFKLNPIYVECSLIFLKILVNHKTKVVSRLLVFFNEKPPENLIFNEIIYYKLVKIYLTLFVDPIYKDNL